MMKLFSSLLTWTVLLVGVFVPVLAQPRASRSVHYIRYKGAWFAIDYPAGWKINLVSQSKTSVTGVDSVQFTSPQGSAAFYVFSPEWDGDSQYARVKSGREKIVSQRTASVHGVKSGGGRYLYNPVVHWYTVRAKDHAYWRSWVDVEDKSLNVRHVFGIQYRNLAAYQKYQAQYDHFCKSLEQFSD